MQMFPIYRISLKWARTATTERQLEYLHEERWSKGAPEGKFWDSTNYYKMFTDIQDIEDVLESAYSGYLHMVKSEKYQDGECELFELKVEFVEFDTWVLQWFSHTTLDIGQTDAEAVASFEEFVSRKQDLNERARWKGSEYDKYCLMGADQRFRWHSGSTDYNGIPCRCSGCKSQGVLRICH